MLTWRYHLLSLVGVFLALGLGVLVGISVSDTGVLETSQDVLVQDIQSDLDGLRTENSQLGRDRATNIRFQDDTFPFIVGGRLQGKRIAIVASATAGDEVVRKLTSAIHAAGGQVTSTTVLNPRFDLPALTAKIRTDMKNDPAFASVDDASMATLVGRQLARDISKGGGVKLLGPLQGSMVDSTNGSYDTPVDAVVLVTKADNEQIPAYTDFEKIFLLSLKDLGIPAVGTETQDAPVSEIPLFQSVDVSSVDNLDSRVGQVSVVYVLSGEKGTFGIKPTADLLIPILRAPKQSTTQTPAQSTATTSTTTGAAP
ncbi:MAG: copper transporter [Thermoleophilia bacterium]|nr:copper transporter [Thermoleophilia bacterium]